MRNTLRTIRPAWLVAVAIVAAAAGWFVNVMTSRATLATPVLPLSSLATMGLIVVVTVILGWKVRRWRDGDRKHELNPLLAARTVVLAQACAYAGTVLFGWHAGLMVYQAPSLGLRSDFGVIWQIVALLGGGAVMVVTGLVVERFCKLPPEDEEPAEGVHRGKRDGRGEEEFA
ncbi:DUF3180 domain-containing protein [Specibacter cremeus]|uniref:DUF3180 domain-containing protein n=1 Tax=Specibacter cremeus TaxID=1629051 RepID=UPI001F0C34B0|nr:DUF3180 domain-containing protein [Specibacter cremeus]